jgi:hypothetical protein
MISTKTSLEDLETAALQLMAYCQANNWAGYDPYDALNSNIFKSLPFLDFRLFRLALTQLLKRSPVNIRPLLLVPKTQNPKAIALFLMAFLKLKKLGLLKDKELIPQMVQKLITLRSPHVPSSVSSLPPRLPASPPPGNEPFESAQDFQLSAMRSEPSYFCWGYSFPWQTRTILVPRWAPNLVCTCFVANALLDAYESQAQHRWLEMAVSASDYILKELYWENDDCVGFAYPTPSSHARVHNANFLGAALLCRVSKLSGDKNYLEPALKATRYSANKQHDDGSWQYGEDATQRWIDNFHTGYNLCALRSISQYAATLEFEPNISRGFEFYRGHFFNRGGSVKYFHDRTYPIDTHSVAQSIITLLTLNNLDSNSISLAFTVFQWAMNHMQDKHGYFYYQKLPYRIIKIPYMRWSQAWMLYALSILLDTVQTS